MNKTDLDYEKLVKLIRPFTIDDRTESAAFLRWFLAEIFRLDDTSADDAICDSKNDKGVDGVYVSAFDETVYVFQAKLTQNPKKTLGDTHLKEFSGTLDQFRSGDAVRELMEGTAHPRLKQLLTRTNAATAIDDGYNVTGVFISNISRDKNAEEYLSGHSLIRLYDADEIANEYVDMEADGGVAKKSVITAFEGQMITYKAGDQATLYQFIAEAADLVALGGIDDQSLFSQNVRLSLGNSKVNKDIAKSIGDKASHKRFPLFHNGITLLARKITPVDNGIEVEDYVVVNGAQSLSTLNAAKEKLTEELRINVRAVELNHRPELAKEITHNSNNQNAIKARDLKANHTIQQRLQVEMTKEFGDDYAFAIKRGEVLGATDVISNEDAGALMLAMDLQQPWACHQRYKFFDDFYADIFGRPEVTPERIVFLFEVGENVKAQIAKIKYAPIANYKLTYYFVLSCLAQLMQLDNKGRSIYRDPSAVFNCDGYDSKIHEIVGELVSDIIVDLNYEIKKKGEDFDFKADFKSPKRVASLADEIVKNFEKQAEKGRAKSFAERWDEILFSTELAA
jgi:hypothetical protein